MPDIFDTIAAPKRDIFDDVAQSFDTPVPFDRVPEFQQWTKRYAPPQDSGDYDYGGAFLAGVTPNAEGHWPDTFKKPNHPTFSDESQYAKAAPNRAGHWDGETFTPHRDIFDSVADNQPPEIAQSEAQQAMERGATGGAPQWANNAAEGFVRSARKLIPESIRNDPMGLVTLGPSSVDQLRDVAGMFSPANASIDEVIKAARIAKDVANGSTPEEATRRHAPESFYLADAEKTAPYSKERFEAGFDTVAQMLMAKGIAKGHAKAGEVPKEKDRIPPQTIPEAYRDSAPTDIPVPQTESSLPQTPVSVSRIEKEVPQPDITGDGKSEQAPSAQAGTENQGAPPVSKDSGIGEFPPKANPEPQPASDTTGQMASTYINGDKAEYTGETRQIAGGTFYVLKMVEGRKVGQEAVTSRPPIGPDPNVARAQKEWQDQQADARKLHGRELRIQNPASGPMPPESTRVDVGGVPNEQQAEYRHQPQSSGDLSRSGQGVHKTARPVFGSLELGADVGARKVRPGQRELISAAQEEFRAAINKNDYATPRDRADAIVAAREKVQYALAGITPEEEAALMSQPSPHPAPNAAEAPYSPRGGVQSEHPTDVSSQVSSEIASDLSPQSRATIPDIQRPQPEITPPGEEPSRVGIAHSYGEERFPGEIDRGEGTNVETQVARGRDLLNRGVDPGQIVRRVEKTGRISGDDMAVLRAQLETLQHTSDTATEAARTNPDPVLQRAAEQAMQNELAWRKAIKPAATAFHEIGMTLQGQAEVNYGTFAGLRRAAVDLHGKDVNPAQAATLKEVANRVRRENQLATESLQRATTQVEQTFGRKAPARSVEQLRNDLANRLRELTPC